MTVALACVAGRRVRARAGAPFAADFSMSEPDSPINDGAESAADASVGAAEVGAAAEGVANPVASESKSIAFTNLPHYSRSLLKVRIPVSVHLATKKETVQEIVELVPGSIVKFEKGCDQLLEMVIGGQRIAEGEAVKIGDKFGFRVTSMLRPREHFVLAKKPRAG
jgi:flagellar motor switch protein FliN/FliY